MKETNMPRVTRQDIVRGLRAAGIGLGDNLIVHTALSAFGKVDGGAETVVDAVLDAIGPKGTVMFPTFTGDAVIAAILGGGGAKGAVILPEVSNVDLSDLTNPKEEHIFTGAVPKAARRRPDFLKSRHPLYSICAKGPLAAELVAVNERYIFASRENKDFYALGRHGGKAVLMGVSHLSNSSIHLVAEFAGLEYKVQDRPYWTMTVSEFLGLPRARQAELLRLHCGMSLGYNIKKQYDRIEAPLKAAGLLGTARIGHAEVRSMKIEDLLRVGLEAVRKNPWFLADKLGA